MKRSKQYKNLLSKALSTLTIVSLAAVTMAPSETHAQVSGDQALQAASQSSVALPPDSLGGALMFGQLGEDIFATLNLRLNFDRDNWGLGFNVPVRFRLYDADPENQGDIGGLIRKEDWDELSDFFKVIRYAYIGQRDKKGPYYVRVGELSSLTLGHGTIVNRYTNGLDIDTFRMGANVAVNIGAFGGEIAVGDAARLEDPIIAAARFTVRPLELILGDGAIWDRLVMGFSLVSDPRAPYEVKPAELDADGEIVTPAAASADRSLYVTGVDVGLEVLRSKYLSIEPYMDFNVLNVVENGWGFHAGVLWRANLPVVVDNLIVDMRTEYRRVANDYVGPYFDTAYEIERLSSLSSDSATPKLRLLAEDPGSARNGIFFDVTAGLPNFIFVGGEYIDYDGGENDGILRLTINVPALEFIQLNGFYYRVNVEGLSDLVVLDERSALIAEAKIPLYAIFTLNARFLRVWDRNADGQPQPVDDWNIGIGFNLEL
ncbi:MAG: hypothetical protein VYC39_05425 [Myxococcota bacterium]|nr:hypothetical protein [Myxococcota bacterium]